MTHTDIAHEDSEDRFYAQFDSREVELMTLDELAAAFEEGRIHGNTFVCREGESEWATLSEVAGLGEESEPEAEEVAPPPVVVSERRPPMPQRTVEVAGSIPAQTRPLMPQRTVEVAASVPSQTRPPMPERRPEMNTVLAARFAAVVAAPVAPVVTTAPLSYAPVTSNVDFPSVDLDDEMALRPKRRWGRVLLAAAALTVVGGGAAFALGGGVSAVASAVPSTAAIQAAASKSEDTLALDHVETKPADPVAAAPVAPAADPAPAAAPAADAPSTAPGLSDDMKAALLARDKAKSSKHAAKAAKGGAGAVAHHSKVAHSAGIKSGGNAYDPLNGNL